MNIQIELSGARYQLDLTHPHCLAIPFYFIQKQNEGKSVSTDLSRKQPNHFSVQQASSQVLKGGGFIGDTTQGGSCNVSQLTMIPHCNGTHTETVAHICHDAIEKGGAISDLMSDPLMPAVVVSVEPCDGQASGDFYRPEFDDMDQIISESALKNSLKNYQNAQLKVLIIRTLPNHLDKLSKQYNEEDQPIFISLSAMNYIISRGVQHLVVDFPSVDRMHDEGMLNCHHVFWRVDEGEHTISSNTKITQSITEMCFIDDSIDDGFYFMNLQIPAFFSDAAPSRPILYSAEKL